MANVNVNPLDPTFCGYVASTLDALILFEACLNGLLNHVPRRPHDRERQDLIASGNIFIYEEHASGIKRWTDGISWSPSRILFNFLVYRELDKPFPPGEKKRALKKKRPPSVAKTDSAPRPGPSSIEMSTGKDVERFFVGSLVDSYRFKSDGLVKKTISINYRGVPHHLVSYYKLGDVQSGRLVTPSKHPLCQNTVPRPELLLSQNFRSPIDDIDYDDRGALPQSIITMPLPVANFNTVSPNYEALSPYGFSQGEQPSPQQQVQTHQMQHQVQSQHHHQMQLHFQLEHQAQLSHQAHAVQQGQQSQSNHQLPHIQLPHQQSQHQVPQHQLSHHQLPHHQMPHQLPHYQLPQHQPQTQHQDQSQPQQQPQQPQRQQNQHQHQQRRQHQHQHHSQQQQQQQHQHHYQNSYHSHSNYISSAAQNGITSHGPYIHHSHENYTGVPWTFDEMDKGEAYFDGNQTSDEPPWWPDSGESKAGHGAEETRQ